MNRILLLVNYSLKIANTTTSTIAIRNFSSIQKHHVNAALLMNINTFNLNPSSTCKCLYSTKKSKKNASDSKVHKPKVQLSESELNSIVNFNEIVSNMSKIVDKFKEDLAKSLQLRITTNSIEELPVKTVDGPFKLGELAQVQAKSSNLFVIDMINVPQYIKNIVESINHAKLNVNPQIDKSTVFLKLPQLTREHRENLDKLSKQIYQNAVNKLRDIHNVNIRKAENAKNTSEDTIRTVKETIKYQYDLHVLEADKLRNAKHKELFDEK